MNAPTRPAVLLQRLRSLPPRTRLILAAVLVVVLAVPAALLLLSPRGGETGPVDVVRAYTSAIQRGDATAALDLVGRPAGDTPFLLNEALGGGWTVEAVTERSNANGDATVEAVFSGAARTTATFILHKGQDGRWRVLNPFARVRFPRSPVDFVALNGVRIDATAADPAGEFLLLPGIYRLYPAGNTNINLGPREFAALPGALAVPDLSDLALTPEGEAAARAAVTAYIDACTGWAVLEPYACPFGATDDVGDFAGYEYMHDYSGISWSVESYPEYAITATGAAFTFAQSKPGEVGFSATGVKRRWNGKDFVKDGEAPVKVTCRIDVSRLELRLSAEGVWKVVAAADPGTTSDPAAFRPGASVDTCGGGGRY